MPNQRPAIFAGRGVLTPRDNPISGHWACGSPHSAQVATMAGANNGSGRTMMASIKRHASAEWHGSGKDGTGSLTTQSGVLKGTPYGFSARFGDAKGTNPEELIAV